MVDSWLGSVSLEGVPPAGRQAAEVVLEVLDALRPTRLDVARSAVGIERGQTTFIRLAHQMGQGVEIYLAIEPAGWVNLYGPSGHDEVYRSEMGAAEWIANLREAVAAMLTRTYRLRLDGRRKLFQVIDFGCADDPTP